VKLHWPRERKSIMKRKTSLLFGKKKKNAAGGEHRSRREQGSKWGPSPEREKKYSLGESYSQGSRGGKLHISFGFPKKRRSFPSKRQGVLDPQKGSWGVSRGKKLFSKHGIINLGILEPQIVSDISLQEEWGLRNSYMRRTSKKREKKEKPGKIKDGDFETLLGPAEGESGEGSEKGQ